jgi:RNA polymerase sigma-70 factor (sigma-E family)
MHMVTDQPFGEFVSARYTSLLRAAYLLTGDRGHAEDLVQSALVRTYLGWRRLREPANAEAYTRATMIRLATRWRRRRWSGEVPTGELPEPAGRDHTAAVDDADLVRRALLGLPWAQRTVLVLRYFADQTEAEIAATLGVSVGTVKSRASRGLAALRAAGVHAVPNDAAPGAAAAGAAPGLAWPGPTPDPAAPDPTGADPTAANPAGADPTGANRAGANPAGAEETSR